MNFKRLDFLYSKPKEKSIPWKMSSRIIKSWARRTLWMLTIRSWSLRDTILKWHVTDRLKLRGWEKMMSTTTAVSSSKENFGRVKKLTSLEKWKSSTVKSRKSNTMSKSSRSKTLNSRATKTNSKWRLATKTSDTEIPLETSKVMPKTQQARNTWAENSLPRLSKTLRRNCRRSSQPRKRETMSSYRSREHSSDGASRSRMSQKIG